MTVRAILAADAELKASEERRVRAIQDAMDYTKRIQKLEADLAVNARLLARQCDLAREAETERGELRARLEEHLGSSLLPEEAKDD